jgi:hypothetical protein
MRAGVNLYRAMCPDVIDREAFITPGKLPTPAMCYGGAHGRGRRMSAIESWRRVPSRRTRRRHRSGHRHVTASISTGSREEFLMSPIFFRDRSRLAKLATDGLTIHSPDQEAMAIACLKAHRDELSALARVPGADTFILGLQYRTAFERNVIGFTLAPSAQLMQHCLDVGCVPVYYVTLDRLPEPDADRPDPDD